MTTTTIPHREARVLDALRFEGLPMSAAEVVAATRMPVRMVKTALRELQARGLVRSNRSGSWRAT